MGTKRGKTDWARANSYEPEEPTVKEKPHPLRKIPGTGNRAVWNRRIGRWVVPVLGGDVGDERQG